ncbi:MAG: YifB family Mg chelatase-like AAA ATPase [Planctomycetota bacterium]
MVAHIRSSLLQGVESRPCEVEVDVDERGLDKQTVVGLPDAAVKESMERVRAAMGNSGYAFPLGRTLINLAPADLRKEGPVYDLPIAIGLLAAQGVVRTPRERDGSGLDHRACVVAGELALDGRVRPIKGVIALASMARDLGARAVVVPSDNAQEAAVVEGIDALGVSTLAEAVGLFNGMIEEEPESPPDIAGLLATAEPGVDFADVRGQESVKRAVVVAAAGGHNLLMLGPAGSGKTMMAKALPGVLPPLMPDEALEVTRVWSAAGLVPGGCGLIATRPVRSPHHTASSAAIVGGGQVPRPGEISLAHRGILFLDELPEFPRPVLETLRQPLEDQVVTIARAHGTVRFPADFMLVAAMNPTPKGDLLPGESGRRAMERYLSRLSGPLLDRIDLHVEAPAVPWERLASAERGISSQDMRVQVLAARELQRVRQGTIPNARLSGRQLDHLAPLDRAAEALVGQAVTELGLSARAYDKVRRLARTLADLDGAGEIALEHAAEAIGYRLLDRRVPAALGGAPRR